MLWVSLSWTLGLMWAGVLRAAGGKLQEPPPQQRSDEWWRVMNTQAGERQPAAGYAKDTQHGVAGDVYRAGDGGPAPAWVTKPGQTIDG